MLRGAARAAAAASLAAAAGCFNYVQVPSADARLGTEVRVALAERGVADLTRFVGPRASTLDGRLVARSDTALTLAVTAITRTTGVEETWPGDQVVVPATAVASVQTRRVSRSRTGLLIAGVIALAAVVGAAFAAVEDVNRGGTRPPGGQPQ